jgi:hypothetical protein
LFAGTTEDRQGRTHYATHADEEEEQEECHQ